MKKIVVLLSVVLTASILLCACGKDNKQNKTNTNNESEITNDTTTKEDNLDDTNASDEVTNSTETDTIVGDTETSSIQTPSNSKEETTENNNTTKPSNATTNSNKTTNSNNTTKPSDTAKPSTNQQHTHNYANATCTTAKKCSCGATSGSALGHDYKKGVCSRCQAKDPNYVPSKYEQNLQVLKDYILANGSEFNYWGTHYKSIDISTRDSIGDAVRGSIKYYIEENMLEFFVSTDTGSYSDVYVDFKVSQIENSTISVNYRSVGGKYSKTTYSSATATINASTYDWETDIYFEYSPDSVSDSQSYPNTHWKYGVACWKTLLSEANLTMNDLGFIACK